MELELSIFWHNLCPPEAFLPHITTVENLHFDRKISWKSPEKNAHEKCGNPVTYVVAKLSQFCAHRPIGVYLARHISGGNIDSTNHWLCFPGRVPNFWNPFSEF